MYYESLQAINFGKIEMLNKNHDYLILVGQDSANELKGFMKYIDKLGLKYFGGIYPKLITKYGIVSKGFIVKELNPVYSELVYPFLMKRVPSLSKDKFYTCYLIGDGFSDKNMSLIDTIQSKIVGNVNYIGGGSAFYSLDYGIHKLQQDEVLFNNRGFFKDAMHVCIVEEKSHTKKNLGWDIIGGPYEITNAEGNLIKMIDGENAFEFYKTMLDELEGISVQVVDSLYFASQYTFGLVENEKVINVRVPIEVTFEGHIRVVNEVTENMEVFLLRGNEEKMKYDYQSIKNFPIDNVSDVLMVSCLSRDLFLEDSFNEEIEMVSKVLEQDIEGMITIGEFTNNNTSGEIIIYEGASLVNIKYE